MSRYLDLLNNNKLTLIMSLPRNDVELARAALEEGADVIKMHINLHHHASDNSFGSFEEERENLFNIISLLDNTPYGIVPGQDPDVVLSELDKLIAAKFDFLSLYSEHTPPSIMKDDRILKMIAFNNTYDLNKVALLEETGVDVFEASIMAPDTYGAPMSLLDLIKYRELVKGTALPIVVPTQHRIKANEASSLYSAGIKGIMIGAVVTGRGKDGIKRAVSEFRNEIDKL